MVYLTTYLYLTLSLLINFDEVYGEISQLPRLPPDLQQIILKQAYEKPLYKFPTSFTQGIRPKAIHSHNDYLQPLPFYNALSVGAFSVEADVWFINNTLYVGHELVSLTPNRTFGSLYIDPILSALIDQNPTHSDVFSDNPLPFSQNGVYNSNHYQTLYLWIDLKTDGGTTWPAVIKALEPLRSRGYLSFIDAQKFNKSAVTVIGTGTLPFDLVQKFTQRDYFYDAPTKNLNNPNITNLTSLTSSASFPKTFGPLTDVGLNETQLEILRAQVKLAHAKGIKLRYWDLPEWPVSTRNSIWRQFITEGVDFLCVDDLEAAAGYGDMW